MLWVVLPVCVLKKEIWRPCQLLDVSAIRHDHNLYPGQPVQERFEPTKNSGADSERPAIEIDIEAAIPAQCQECKVNVCKKAGRTLQVSVLASEDLVRPHIELLGDEPDRGDEGLDAVAVP